MQTLKINAAEENKGERLDKFIADNSDISRIDLRFSCFFVDLCRTDKYNYQKNNSEYNFFIPKTFTAADIFKLFIIQGCPPPNTYRHWKDICLR